VSPITHPRQPESGLSPRDDLFQQVPYVDDVPVGEASESDFGAFTEAVVESVRGGA
jgi:hypothetical protein